MDTDTSVSAPKQTTRRRVGDLKVWILTVVLVLGVGAAGVVFAARDDDTRQELGAAGGPVGMSEDELVEFAQSHPGPVYWAGPRHDTTYELTFTTAGDIYIRYLPPGVSVGDERADFLTVATYLRSDPYQALLEVADEDGFESEEMAGGALVVHSPEIPTSVHFAFDDTDLQVEVFDPDPDRALTLVKDGSITLLR